MRCLPRADGTAHCNDSLDSAFTNAQVSCNDLAGEAACPLVNDIPTSLYRNCRLRLHFSSREVETSVRTAFDVLQIHFSPMFIFTPPAKISWNSKDVLFTRPQSSIRKFVLV